MVYVIASGDEGVQINEGVRLGFVGAGFKLSGFSKAVKILKSLVGKELRVVSHSECDWIKEQLALSNWEQVEASTQQYTEALADQESLLYVGILPFSDPKQLKHDVRGHMVRPKKVHVANKIMFTLGGGEQKYNLGCFVISADWVAKADKKLVSEMMTTQIEHYTKISGKDRLEHVFELGGELGEKIAMANKKMLESVGIKEG
jgi:hypothetical protein